MSLENPPTYCERCGKILVKFKEIDRYDRSTGLPIFTNHMRCPKWKEMNDWQYRHHDNVWIGFSSE